MHIEIYPIWECDISSGTSKRKLQQEVKILTRWKGKIQRKQYTDADWLSSVPVLLLFLFTKKNNMKWKVQYAPDETSTACFMQHTSLKYIPWEYDYDLLTWQQISGLYHIKKQGISSLLFIKGELFMFPSTFLLLIWKTFLQKSSVHSSALGNGAAYLSCWHLRVFP